MFRLSPFNTIPPRKNLNGSTMQLLHLLPLAAVVAAQLLEVDSQSYSNAVTGSSLLYISGLISTLYHIDTNTLVILYSTDLNSQIVAASGTTMGKKNGAVAVDPQGAVAAAGLLAGILLI